MTSLFAALIFISFFNWSCSETQFSSTQKSKSTKKPTGSVENVQIESQSKGVDVEIEDVNGPPKITSEPITAAHPGDPLGNAEMFDLTKWQITQYELNEQPDANWVVQPQKAQQTENADASILLSDIDLRNQRIEGRWKTSAHSDDDYMGFVYGYQDKTTFYLFDWKKEDQSDPLGMAKRGMNVKLVKATGDLSGEDLWPTEGNGTRVVNLYHNSVRWDYNSEYTFILDFIPGATHIIVKQADTVLADFTVNDKTLTSGSFGFYNYSQDTITYEGFSRTPVQGSDYSYPVKATDPDDDTLTYSLKIAPDGMTIDPATGEISWKSDLFTPGKHDVTVVVEDGHGHSDEQSFQVEVL